MDPRIDKLASVLVNYSARVERGNLVRISGSHVALPLIESLVEHVVKAGAFPLVRMNADTNAETILRFASDEQLDFVDPVSKFEVETIDRHIGLWADENTRSLTNVNPKRLARQQAARKKTLETFMNRAAAGKLHWTGTQFPTQGSAQDAEMSLREYEDFVFAAGLLHEADPVAAWRKISEKQQRLADHLNGKSDYHVVSANGTDIRMSVDHRTWINCDGHENFPDGEVFTGPVIDSVNGVVNFSFPAVHLGREVEGVSLTFRNGKVVDARASKGEAFLIAMLDTDAGSRYLGECAIGTNFGITRYTRNTLFDEKIGGTVHFAVGAGYPETGNTNESGLHWDMVVDLRQGGYVEIDGEKINVDGKFMRENWPA